MAEAIPPTSPTPVTDLLGTAGFIGDTALGGTTVDVTGGAGDLAAALGLPTGKTGITPCLNSDGTHKGNTYVCPAGVTYTAITLPPTTGTGWTRIKSNGSVPARGTQVTPAGVAQLFTVASAVTPVTIPGGSNGWQFIGLNCSSTQTTTGTGQGPLHLLGSRLIVERSYIHANAACMDTARGILIAGSDIQVWDSWVADIFRGKPSVGEANTGESQAIYFNSAPNSARVHIEHCELRASGENIMFNDQGSVAPAQDVVIKRNRIWKDKTAWQIYLNDNTATPNPSWDGKYYTIKNLFEIKWAKRVAVIGNILEGSWAQVGPGGASLGQNGVALLVNSGGPDLAGGAAATNAFYRSSDVRVEHNTIIDALQLFEIQTVSNIGPVERVAFLNNLGIRVPGHALFHNWAGLDIWFEHNTVVPMNGAVGSVGGGPHSISWEAGTAKFPRNTIRRNIIGKSTYGLYGFSAAPNNGAITTAMADFYTVSNRDYRENAAYGGLDATCAGFTPYANATTIGLSTSTDPAVGGRLASNSILKFANGGGGTDGKDLGVYFPDLDAAQAGTAPTGAIPVANFTHAQTTGTFAIQFTDLSANTPTAWAWSGPDGFSSTLQNPIFTFPTPGDKLITLVASNALGSSPPYTAQVTVAALPGFTHVQTTEGAQTTTLRTTVPSLTVGNLAVVYVHEASGASAVTIAGITDAAGNTYAPVSASGVVNGKTSRLFYSVVTIGSTTPVVVNAQVTGTTPTCQLLVTELNPLLGPPSLSAATPMQTGGGASPMDSGGLVAPAGAALIGYGNGTVDPATPVGWTAQGSFTRAARKLDPVAGTTYSFQPTYAGTQNWLAQMAVFVSSGAPAPDTTAPTVPTGLAHDIPVGTASTRLTWSPSFDAVGVVNYDVRRDGVVVGTVTTAEFTDTGLQSNTAYSYTVRANDAVPNSSAYSAAHVVTTAQIEPGTGLPPRYMRGFGVTRGSGPTDTIQTPDLGHGAARTLTFWLRLDGFGVTQCVFTKASQTVQSLTERVLITTDGKLHFQRQWSNALGDWSVPVPSLGVRHFVVIRYNSDLPSRIPTIKYDNIQQTVTVVTQPTSGVATQNTPGYMLGNVPGSSVVLGGDLARFAVFNFITTDLQDAALFAANPPAGIGVGAVQYVELDGTSAEPDEVTSVPSTVTGTQTQDYEPPSLVTVITAGRRMVGWVR